MQKLFSRPVRATTLPLLLTWFSFGFGYYGLIFLTSRMFSSEEGGAAAGGTAPKDDAFDKLEITLSALSEFAGTTAVYFTVDKVGRRCSQMWTYSVASFSVFLMAIGAAPKLFSIISRAGMMASSSVTWLHAPEVLEVDYRSTGHSLANGMARVGAFLCPYFVGR